MQKIKHLHRSLSDSYADLQSKEAYYYNNLKTGYLMDGLTAPDISYIDDFHEKKIAELAKYKPVLICMYKIECRTCGKDELNELQNVFKDVPETAYILCSHFIKRELYLYAKQHRIDIPLFGILLDSFDWTAENYNKTYFFVLHPDRKISHFFFPDIQYPEFNRQYLESVKQFLSAYHHEVVLEDRHTDHDCCKHSDTCVCR